MLKKLFFIFLLLIFFGVTPAFCYDKETYVRVGISDTYFSKYVFSQIDLYSDDGLKITDTTTGQTFSPENGRISVNFSKSKAQQDQSIFAQQKIPQSELQI